MLIEYYATNQEDDTLFEWMEKLNIKYTEAFNPEDYYFVLETEDDRIFTVMGMLGIEMYASAGKIASGSAKL
jgi:hypothetical protein